MEIMKYLLPFALLLLTVTMVSCYAEPNTEDLERVKSRFLLLRFQAPLTREYRNLTDKELFELSCAQNRVRCSKVYSMLERTDAGFYRKLTGGEK